MIKKNQLLEKMTDFILQDPGNYLKENFRIFDAPLLGICRADDPLFIEMKKEHIIGSLFRTPVEWLDGAASVISFFIPFSEELRRSNYPKDTLSVEWQHGRFMGEDFNKKLRQLLIQELEAAGGRAVAPALEKGMVIDHKIFRSSWSERHVAYIAGLGTFSLNRGLITNKGMAGRFGSVITNLDLTPDSRKYSEPFQYCPGLRDNSCSICIERCPAGAITREGMEKLACRNYNHREDDPIVNEFKQKYKYPYSACGKCQTCVPCEKEIP